MDYLTFYSSLPYIIYCSLIVMADAVSDLDLTECAVYPCCFITINQWLLVKHFQSPTLSL